jgi:nitroreductase
VEVIEAIRNRRSIRGYKTDPISKDLLEEIVQACQWAGSPGNMQPWEFAVLGGDVMEEFKRRIASKREAKASSELEFLSTSILPELYDKRRTIYFKDNLESYLYPLGTENVEAKKLDRRNASMRFYDAPNIIIIYTDKELLNVPWVTMSLGIISQTICLAAYAYGLGTCIMGGPADWPDMLRELLGIPQSKVFLCGITIGYADVGARANNAPRKRIPLEEWVHWHGF